MNWELPDVQAGFRKGGGIRDQIANIHWVVVKAKDFQKNIYLCFTNYTKFFDCVDHNKLENSSREGNTRPPYLPPEKPVCRSRSKLSPCLFNLHAETSWEMLGWRKHKLESRLPGEISITSDIQMTPPLWQKVKIRDESERGEWKSWLKIQHSGNKDHGIWSHHFMANRWGNSGTSETLYFLGLQNHCRQWLQPWI